MNCEHAREQLTAYLDGELEGDRASAIRGHLRTCDACRAMSSDEAALRDGLRALPPVDPPPSLWAGVQQRLAAAEMADAKKPPWRLAVTRWVHTLTTVRVGVPALAATCALAILAWRWSQQHQHHDAPPPPIAVAPVPVTPAPAPAPAVAAPDVTADLASDASRASADYAKVAAELAQLATDARAGWPDDKKQQFDGRLAELRKKVDAAPEGAKRHKAYRALIRFLQDAAVREEVALK